jgi:dolichol-phosphate mannosyltransferase
MTEELLAQPPRPGMPARLRAGVRSSANWLELVRFALVGASGYVVNLVVFAIFVHALGTGYIVAATAAFLVAVTNNFVWNRSWTFRATSPTHPRAHHQAARFLVVSLVGFGGNLALLALLVDTVGLQEVPAQALAIVLATPLTFLGNKLWTFDG